MGPPPGLSGAPSPHPIGPRMDALLLRVIGPRDWALRHFVEGKGGGPGWVAEGSGGGQGANDDDDDCVIVGE
eukprot:2293479-Pyramimonas_sp.AAC.1